MIYEAALYKNLVTVPKTIRDSLGNPDSVVLCPQYETMGDKDLGFLEVRGYEGDVGQNEVGIVRRLDKRGRTSLRPEMPDFLGYCEGDRLMFVSYDWGGSRVTEIWSPGNWEACKPDKAEFEKIVRRAQLVGCEEIECSI